MSVESDLRAQLLGNVVVNGGGSLLAGFVDRLHNELVRNFSTVSYRILSATEPFSVCA